MSIDYSRNIWEQSFVYIWYKAEDFEIHSIFLDFILQNRFYPFFLKWVYVHEDDLRGRETIIVSLRRSLVVMILRETWTVLKWPDCVLSKVCFPLIILGQIIILDYPFIKSLLEINVRKWSFIIRDEMKWNDYWSQLHNWSCRLIDTYGLSLLRETYSIFWHITGEKKNINLYDKIWS